MTGNVSYNDAAFPFGGFNDMVSHLPQSSYGNPKFTASIDYSSDADSVSNEEYSFKVSFQNHIYEPRVSNVAIINNTKRVSLHFDAIEDKKIKILIETPFQNLTNMGTITNKTNMDIDILAKDLEFILYTVLQRLENEQETNPSNTNLSNSKKKKKNLNTKERALLKSLINTYLKEFRQPIRMNSMEPIRTKPKRFYERTVMSEDPEGKHIPEVLANINRSKKEWITLTRKLNLFGKKSGLFEDFCLRSPGSSESDPFSILFKISNQESGEDLQNWHNIMDLGFGVGQILPIITELHADTNNKIILMQQPEVHLHPRAQAEFGSVLCEIAGRG